MSRIFGVVSAGEQISRIERDVKLMATSMKPSDDFATELDCSTGIGLGRLFFKRLSFLTHLYKDAASGDRCLFSGYFRDYPGLQKQVLNDSRGAVAIRNPAHLISYVMAANGNSGLHDLNGCYIFALWRAESRTLQLGTDRFGLIPLYYRASGDQVAFATEIKGLLALKPDGELNWPALEEMLTLGHSLGEGTLYQSILRLPSSTILTFKDGKVTQSRYWWYDEIKTDQPIELEEFIAEARRLFGHSVENLMSQVTSPAIMLSAGFDSRRILLEMMRCGKPTVAYTAPIVQPEGLFTCDIGIARALCNEFGIPHIAAPLSPAQRRGEIAEYSYSFLDFDTISHDWILPLLPHVSPGVGVNFDGLGGDVFWHSNFTGQRQAALGHDASLLAGAVLERFPSLWPIYFKKRVEGVPLKDRIAAIMNDLPEFDHRLMTFFFLNWSRRKTALFTSNLVSLKMESVFPFMDYDLINFLFCRPPLWKRRNNISEVMLLRMHPDLMTRIPSSHTPEIFTNPLAKDVPFADPVPEGYQRQAKASTRRAAVRRAHSISLVDCSDRVQNLIKVHSFLPNLELWSSWYSKRSWPLQGIGFYALQRHLAQNQEESALHLSRARAYVYGAP